MGKSLTQIAAIFATTLVLSTPALATNPQAIYENPDFGAMTADLLITRPITLATTIVGSAIFLLSSPFAWLGDNLDQTGETLVKGPFRATFSRCLGCSLQPDAR